MKYKYSKELLQQLKDSTKVKSNTWEVIGSIFVVVVGCALFYVALIIS